MGECISGNRETRAAESGENLYGKNNFRWHNCNEGLICYGYRMFMARFLVSPAMPASCPGRRVVFSQVLGEISAVRSK